LSVKALICNDLWRPQVDKLAAGMMQIGIEKGDRVGIWSPNTLEWVLTQFATARIGAILVSNSIATSHT